MAVKEGFYKVSEQGGSFVTATFFNPVTEEYYTKCVRDYDYADGSRDDDEAYFMQIDETARKAWLKKWGIIEEGDVVEVFKGRKVPIGTVAKVTKIYDWKDCYGRVQATYAVLDNGMKTSVYNCRLV